jgi:5-methylcytosine-specific restriction endonuclease McrA
MRIDGQFHAEHSACARRGQRVAARVVDHIVSIARGGAVFDPLNHQSLCRSCNVVKG